MKLPAGHLTVDHVRKAARWRKMENAVKSFLGNSLHLLSEPSGCYSHQNATSHLWSQACDSGLRGLPVARTDHHLCFCKAFALPDP